VTAAKLVRRLEGVKIVGDGRYEARCPSHDDAVASLSLTQAEGKVLVCCHAGCTANAIMTAIRLSVSDLFDKPANPALARRIVYGIKDAAGVVVAEHVRQDFPDGSKTFAWRRHGRSGLGGMPTSALPLYGTERLARAYSEPIVVVEGEKARDSLIRRGIMSVGTVTGAAGTPDVDVLRVLADRDVILWPDADTVGRDHMHRIAERLATFGVLVRWLEVFGATESADAADFDRTDDELVRLIAAAPPWRPTDCQSVESVADWPEPIDLDALAVPTVPLVALPRVLRAQVEDVARIVQVAPDLPAALGLGVLAAACARRVEVAIGRTHTEPVNLWVAPVAETGERKTPPFREMLAPVYALEEERRLTAGPSIAAAAEARRLADKRLEHLRGAAARTSDPAERGRLEAEAKQLATVLPSVPARPTFVVSDRTVEKLEQDLAEQDGALLLADEEAGTLFAIACGRYSRDGASNLDVYLKAYDGGAINTGRISRENVECPDPALSIVVTPQPIIVQQLRERPELHHRGMLPRFAWIMVPTLVGRRPYIDMAPRADVRAAYDMMVRQLFDLPKASQTAPPRRLMVTGAALDVWRTYSDRVEVEMTLGGRLEPIREWANKQPGRVARIAGIFHMAEQATATVKQIVTTDTISAETMSAACTIGEWLEAHALAAYDAMAADPQLGDARRVLRWLRREEMKTFTERDAFRAVAKKGSTMDDFRPTLGLLVETEHIRPGSSGPTRRPGRPPSPTYVTNPATLKIADRIDAIPDERADLNSVNSVSHPEQSEPEVWL
jgi:hypothetical protein